jgi:hypothetical protein
LVQERPDRALILKQVLNAGGGVWPALRPHRGRTVLDVGIRAPRRGVTGAAAA